MKRLMVMLSILFLFAAFLLFFSFIFIGFMVHTSFDYEVYTDGEFCGTVLVNRYVTEDKVVYKSSADLPNTLEYQRVEQKVVLKRNTLEFLKYSNNAEGARGGSRTILVDRNGDSADLLRLDGNVFFTIKGFETGPDVMVFPQNDVLGYMLLMDRYNYWKRGTQFFNVAVPLDEQVVPIVKDRVEAKFVRNEFYSFMRRKIEAEQFIIKGADLPEATVILSDFAHIPLYIEIPTANTKYVLKAARRNYGKFFSRIFTSFGDILSELQGDEKGGLQLKHVLLPGPGKKAGVTVWKQEEIFFGSDKNMISGRLWMPEGGGPFTGVILVTDDGIMTRGQQLFLESLSEAMASNGIAVLDFDSPGQGKSQGNISGAGDEDRIRAVIDGCKYLVGLDTIRKDRIVLAGYKGGGYIVLKAAEQEEGISSCVLLELPLYSAEEYFKTADYETFARNVFLSYSMSEPDKTSIGIIRDMGEKLCREVGASEAENMFFMGKVLPLKGFRQYLLREPFNAASVCAKPSLMIFGRDSATFVQGRVDQLKTVLDQRMSCKTAVFRNLGKYLGNVEKADGKLSFVGNYDLLDLVIKWIKEETDIVPLNQPSVTEPEEPRP